MTAMPLLETERLIIRPFRMEDLDPIHRILDVELADSVPDEAGSFARRREWLEWSVRNYEQLASMYQPPYGDRAVVLKAGDRLIGAAGYAPCQMPFGQLPFYQALNGGRIDRRFTNEFGLYYALSPSEQRRGYATEAARALVDYAFDSLHLSRIVANSSYNNAASIGVMRKLGMRIERNPEPDPEWFQVIGILEQ